MESSHRDKDYHFNDENLTFYPYLSAIIIS